MSHVKFTHKFPHSKYSFVVYVFRTEEAMNKANPLLVDSFVSSMNYMPTTKSFSLSFFLGDRRTVPTNDIIHEVVHLSIGFLMSRRHRSTQDICTTRFPKLNPHQELLPKMVETLSMELRRRVSWAVTVLKSRD